MNFGTINTTNYLVPSEGNTQGVQVTGIATANPYHIDWQAYSVNNQPFIPQGVFIDNTQGTDTCTVVIGPMGYTMNVQAGASGQYQFPAPRFQTADITGAGQVNLIFVNFPVLPDASDVRINGVPDVTITGVDGGLSFDTVPAVNNGGIPYDVNIRVGGAAYGYTKITTGTSGSIIPSAQNLYLRRLLISVSENATLSAAGVTNISAVLNGVTIWQAGIYLPTSQTTGAGAAALFEIPFDTLAFNAGTGNLSINVSTALTNGQIDVNAYFGD